MDAESVGRGELYWSDGPHDGCLANAGVTSVPRPVCQECDELSLGVPGLCLGEAGDGASKRCKWLISKHLKPPLSD